MSFYSFTTSIIRNISLLGTKDKQVNPIRQHPRQKSSYQQYVVNYCPETKQQLHENLSYPKVNHYEVARAECSTSSRYFSAAAYCLFLSSIARAAKALS
jgi:hypothetical protein